MIKFHIEEQKQEVKVVDEFVCNKCGNSFVAYHWGMKDYHNSQVHNFHLTFDNRSKHYNKNLNFDLCEDCLLEFVRTFKVEARPLNWWEEDEYIIKLKRKEDN